MSGRLDTFTQVRIWFIFQLILVLVEFANGKFTRQKLWYLLERFLILRQAFHREAESHKVIALVFLIKELLEFRFKLKLHQESDLAAIDNECFLCRVHGYAITARLSQSAFLDLSRHLFVKEQLIEAARHLIVVKVGECELAGISVCQVRDSWVEDFQQLAAETRKYRQSACIKHQNKESIIPCPCHIINLQVCLAQVIKRWIIISRNELE